MSNLSLGVRAYRTVEKDKEGNYLITAQQRNVATRRRMGERLTGARNMINGVATNQRLITPF